MVEMGMENSLSSDGVQHRFPWVDLSPLREGKGEGESLS
jgi:hypothetical protein